MYTSLRLTTGLTRTAFIVTTGSTSAGGAEVSATCCAAGSWSRSVTRNAAPASITAAALMNASGDDIAKPSSGRGRRATWLTARRTGSDLEPEAASGPRPLPGRAQPAQPPDQERVVGEGLGTVDEGVEDLVVARRGHVELLADGLLLGAGVLPPLALEVEDLTVALGQVGCRARGRGDGVRGVHTALLCDCSWSVGPSLGREPQRCHLPHAGEPAPVTAVLGTVGSV